MRALRSEFARVNVDRAGLGSAVFAALLGMSVIFVLPEKLSEAPRGVIEALFAGLRTTVVTNGVLLSSIYGSFRLTSELNSGVLARQLMYSKRITLYFSRAMFAIVGGMAIGAIGCAVGQVAYSLVASMWNLDLALVWTAGLLGLLSAAWGFGLGAVIGNHFVALFVVPVTLAIAIPLASLTKDVARLTPFGGQLALVDEASGTWLAPHNGLMIAIVWVVGMLIAGYLATERRDVS